MKKLLPLIILLLPLQVLRAIAGENNVSYVCDAFTIHHAPQKFIINAPRKDECTTMVYCKAVFVSGALVYKQMENLEREPEVWLPVKNYEGCYEVSSWGNMRSLDRWRTNGKVPILVKGATKAFGDNGKGYLNTIVYNQDKKKCLYVHRLVGAAFVPNPLNLPEINHLDGIKSNNYYKNLQWCTRKQNCRHQWDVLGQLSPMTWMKNEHHFNSRPTFQYDLRGNFIKEYTCAADAARQINGNKFSICMVCREPFYAPGKRRSHKGFYWSREKIIFA